MRDVAVVSFAQSPCEVANRRDDMADILLPVIRQALGAVGLDRDDIDFFVSGSHDFFEGRTFSYIESLDAVGAWPPISESHVEMDAAWAFAEAWSWLQLGEGDIALVYGIGRGSLATDLDQVLPTQLDPYLLAPLRPHRDALAGLQAAALVDAGLTSERHLAEIVVRSLAAAVDNPYAQKSGQLRVEDVLRAPYVSAPLREHDVAPVGDAAAVVVLAAGDAARGLSDQPAWVRGLDHRMDTHYPGVRDLTRSESARVAAERAAEQAGFGVSEVDIAELHTEYSYAEPLLVSALGLKRSTVNPSGGPLAGRPVTATGLVRIGEAARHIIGGTAERALAHATNGQALQHNLVCLLSGEARS
ncbi:acetyl-CoA acetyltransferase [Saccharomonospora amisosensis]|uniref:Acetyl-CoA acetyltransferase n=1 Tax=Saccharomonospora amisosensis TaxID=1128677 RepID=A0A7X5ZRI5_9PSEU|nr:lipid-transfer protein [Saccharomonospora amisosensis]NIJ12566.1 acetyl-CoA acetyltransferase [Saccharomonospora amisosensis]